MVEEESVSMGGAAVDSPSGSSSAMRAPLPPSTPQPTRNRGKHGGRRVPSSSTTRFKGVVLQQNGHWGAQIYANHQRVWLGTFKSEAEAAAAYDSAAIRLRPADSHRNFPLPLGENYEPTFQRLLPTDALLAMIKDGSYPAKLHEFLCSGPTSPAAAAAPAAAAVVVRRLFEKELTPSDVGKLNRLVIPKKHAVKHFPGASGSHESELVFRDPAMRQWRFRYCYWRSSQSFVFTRGWSRFVREKRLRENDAVIFYSCSGPHVPGAAEGGFLLIDVVRASNAANGPSSVSMSLSQCANNSNSELSGLVIEAQDLLPKKPINSFMLFGVQICASE